MTIAGKQNLNKAPRKSELFNPEHFFQFCENLVIDTKEFGKIKLRMNGSQKYLIYEIAEGLAEGQHTFIVLKGRQLGMTTISYALTLYWEFKFKGTQGSLVTDTDSNRDKARSMLKIYIQSLPRKYRAATPVENNRNQMVLSNDSRLSFIVAGTKKKSSEMGTGQAINFCHATEISSWGDAEAVPNLIATFAEQNPYRLYIFESTARGYDNPLPDMWDDAKESQFQRAIFVGWWRNELYRKEKDSPEYRIYWDGHLTSEERVWVEEVKELYDFDIEAEQIAWWRWKLAEGIKDELRMYQEYPPTEDFAFQLTGSKFFAAAHLTKDYKAIKDIEAAHFCYQMGQYFEFTSFYDTNEENAELTIWEGYEPGKHIYVIGADPAYGSSDWADRFVASVWKCYADRVEQVAEYCTSETETYQFAWVLAHLCGEYGGALLNLEITGPGQAVFNELRNLAQMGGSPGHPADIYDVLGNVRHYFYKRQDSLASAYAFQWQTNQREKERLFNTYRDYYERGMLVIRSRNLIKEMRSIVRDGGSINGEGSAKDDRVMGAGLAVVAWNDFIMHELIQNNVTYALCSAEKEYGKNATLVSKMTKLMIENALRNPLDD